MKITKTHVIVAGLMVIFVVVVLFLHVRAISQLEAAMVGQLKEEAEAKARSEFADEKAEFAEKESAWIKASTLAGEAYSAKTEEAVNERTAKEAARRANASLNTTWEAKFTTCDTAHKKTIEDWAASEMAIGLAHSQEVGALRSQVIGLKLRVYDLELSIDGTFDADGKLVKPGYIQREMTLKAELVLSKRKAKRAFWFGLQVGSIGGAAAGVKIGLAL